MERTSPISLIIFSFIFFLAPPVFAESPPLDYECDVKINIADDLECIAVDAVSGVSCEREITFDNDCVDDIYVLEQDCDDDTQCTDLTLRPNEIFTFVLEADEEQYKSLRRFLISETDHDGIVEVSLTYHQNHSPDPSGEASDNGSCSTTNIPSSPLPLLLLGMVAIVSLRRS